jgi:hypothetical protein
MNTSEKNLMIANGAGVSGLRPSNLVAVGGKKGADGQ